MSNQEQSRTSTFPLVASILTVVLVLGAIAIIALDRLDITRGRSIEDAPQPPLLLPLVSGILLLIAAGWTYWLIRKFGPRHIVTVILSGATVVLLVLTPLFAWQAITSDRKITVISMICNAETLRDPGMALANCEEEAVETIALLEGVHSADQWVPDTVTGNLTREFRDLPPGSWETMLTVDGPPDTVAVIAQGVRGDDRVQLGNLRPYMDENSGQLRWTARVALQEDISTVRILFYLSENPAIESASMRFEIRECSGQNMRSFDASACQPMQSPMPFVIEKTPTDTRTWRHPRVRREGSEIVISNLEARTYVLEPDYLTIEMHTQNTNVLIIPAAMPQLEENSITEPGASSFDVTIESNTGELSYIIYVFPTGPTFITAPSPFA